MGHEDAPLGEEPEPDDVFTTSSRESSRGPGTKIPAAPSVSGTAPLPPIGGTFAQGRDGTFRCLPAPAARGGSLRSVGGGGGGGSSSRGGANSVPLSGGGRGAD